jgi:hypothetical protein
VRDGSITEVVYDPATASLIPGIASGQG